MFWTLNNNPLPISKGIHIMDVGGRTSLLTINPVRNYHKGVYRCMASNSVGIDESATQITINGTWKHHVEFDNSSGVEHIDMGMAES